MKQSGDARAAGLREPVLGAAADAARLPGTLGERLRADAQGYAQSAGLPYPQALRHIHRLYEATTGMSRFERVLAESDDPRRTDFAAYGEALARLVAGEPLAHVLGEWPFREHVYRVSPAVLIPRPETELLVDLALGAIASHPAPKVLDLGTGSGCIAIEIALARQDAAVTAVDISADALDVAADNAGRLGADRVRFVRSDWYGALAAERFDVIVANPPYVAEGDPHLAALRDEPAGALIGGADGLAALRAVVHGAPGHLQGPAWLAVEHGFDQSEAVQALFRAAGFASPRVHTDLAGVPRAVSARLSVPGLNG